MALGETLREFGVKVSLAFDGKKVDEAEAKIKKFRDELRGFALEVAGVTAALFESQNLFTSNARSLQNQADSLAITTGELQDYEYAAKVAANVNREDLVSSFESLSETMDKARAGDVAARQTLENIGGAMGNQSLIIGKLSDKTYKVTDAMKDMSAGIEKISKTSPQAARRLTEQALGSDKLYNMMRQGPKVIGDLTAEGRKNFTLNDKMIKQGYQMDIQMSKLWMMFRKFGYEIGYSVMKHLTPMINAFTKWFIQNKKLIASGINAFLDILADGLQVVFEIFVALAKVISPVIDAVGGMKNAMRILVGSFLIFKALNIGAAFIGMIGPIFKLVSLLPVLGTVFSSLGGFFSAFKAFSLIGSLADVLPALELFASGAIAALAPLLPIILGISAAAVGIHDLVTLLSGGSFKDTWTGKGFEKAKEGVGWIGDKVKGFAGGGSAPYSNVTPNGAAVGGGGGTAVTQENHFNTNNTIQVPSGTTSHAASAMISKANVDSHDKMMVKAKMDAARRKVY
jgi:hypothetical protein